MDEDYDQKDSKFNAGILQTKRLHDILVLLNFCKANPLAINMDYNDWNYNIWFKQIKTLHDEIDAWIVQKEREELLAYRKKISELMKKYPVHETIKKQFSKEQKVNEANWKLIEEGLEKFERRVKHYGLKYKLLGTPAAKAGRI